MSSNTTNEFTSKFSIFSNKNTFIFIFISSFVIPIIIYDEVRQYLYKIKNALDKISYYFFKNMQDLFCCKCPKNNDIKEIDNKGNKNLKVVGVEEKLNENENDTMFAITFLGRLVITYYSFYGVIFIYNFAIQFLILIPGIMPKIDNMIIGLIQLFLYFLYSIFYSRILVIPTFEFFSFPFIRFNDPLSHLWTFKYILKDEKFEQKYVNRSYEIINYSLILIEFWYLISFIFGILSIYLGLKDIFNLFILIVIYIYYLSIFFSYCFIILFLCIKKRKTGKYINEEGLPDINLINYFISPSEKENKELIQNNETYNFYFLLLLEVIFFIILIIYFMIFKLYNKGLLSLLTYFVLGFICRFKFPLYFGINREKKPENSKMIFLIIVFCILICTLTSSTLIYILFIKNDYNNDLYNFKKFKNIRSSHINLGRKKDTILPSICSASVYNIPIISYIPFINDAYYYKNNISSLDYKNYKNIFFNDSEYNISLIRNLINDEAKEKKVKMIQYNLNSLKDNVTILSIKGTSYNNDIYLDIQLYTPSVFLNLLLNFSIFMKLKERLPFRLLEYGLSIPYRLFFKNTIIDDYIKVLNETYNKHKEFDENKVVIVGHSLGGGLSKILGKMVKKPSIALSGPGSNAFHSLWGKEGINNNFDIATIDLVPDMDLVPRVEVSGGTIYRIICRDGPFSCHSKDLSLCEVLIMCQKPHQIVCRDIAELKEEDIERIKEASILK